MSPTKTDIIRRLVEAGLKPPRAVTLAVTNRCNLSCRHCWPVSGPDEKLSQVPRDQVSRLIEGFAALGAEKIVITGGEPLTHPDWFDLLSFACSRPGVEEVRLQTNAILITPAHVDAFLSLKDQGLIIQTSLEGATAVPHDRVRGSGSFDLTMQGLRRLQKSGMAPRVCITFTEMQHNFEDIPGLLKIADDMGIGQFVTGTLVIGGRAAQPGGLAPPTPAQYEKLLARYQRDKTFRDRYHRIGNIAALEWFMDTADAAGTCCTFIETPYITAKGNLYPCVMLQADDFAATRAYGRSLTTAISEKIDSWARLQQISRSRLTQLDICKDCPDYAGCGAGCMGRAYSAHGDCFSAEDRCDLRKAVYGRRSANKATIAS
ncbi:MAG: radical SAM protein [Desulfobacterales bacterium]